MSLLDKLNNVMVSAYDNTFGQMTGPQIFWTIIGLLVLYQLVMIKWRLIDIARQNRTPHSFMTRPSLRSVGFGPLTNRNPMMPRPTGRSDMARAIADPPADFSHRPSAGTSGNGGATYM